MTLTGRFNMLFTALGYAANEPETILEGPASHERYESIVMFAYPSAQNRGAFQTAMQKAANNAQRRTLIELFGEHRLEGLSEPHRTFIGVVPAR